MKIVKIIPPKNVAGLEMPGWELRESPVEAYPGVGCAHCAKQTADHKLYRYSVKNLETGKVGRWNELFDCFACFDAFREKLHREELLSTAKIKLSRMDLTLAQREAWGIIATMYGSEIK